MYTIPAASKLNSLVGRTLEAIVLGSYSVQFLWEGGGRISSEFDIEHVDEEGTAFPYDGVAHSGPPLKLHRLLGRKVEGLEVEELCFTLLFEDGARLRLFTEVGPYECGLVQFSDDVSDFLVY